MLMVGKHVRSVTDKDGTTILDLRSNQVLGLHGAGSFIWDGLKHGNSPAEIVKGLIESTGASRELVERDVRKFVNHLMSKGMICEIPHGQASAPDANASFERQGGEQGKCCAATTDVLLAFVALLFFDVVLRLGGFRMLRSTVRRFPVRPALTSSRHPEEIISAVNSACCAYFTTTKCLERSAALTCLLRLHGT
jgi:hypothetical protein